MKNIKMTIGLLKENIRALFVFELVYHALLTLVCIPALTYLFSVSMKAAGVAYLSDSNVLTYLAHPVTVLILLVTIMAVAIVIIFEIASIVYCFHASYYQVQITATEMLYAGLHELKQFFQNKSFLLMFYVILIIPFINFGIQSGFVSSIQIPEFIMDFILHNLWLCIGFYTLVALLTVYALYSLFSLQFFTLQTISYGEAQKRSHQLIRGKFVHTVGAIVIWNLIQYVVMTALTLVLVEIVVLGVKLIGMPTAVNTAYEASEAAITILFSVSVVLAVPLGLARICTMYYTYCAGKSVPVPELERVHFTVKNRGVQLGINLILILLALDAIVMTVKGEYREVNGVTIYSRPEVQAHRGDSVSAPENSMPAFLAAIEDGADWIELDVHQTSDGVVVVTHDDDLKRIAGVNKKIWELTYEELEQYDTGSWFAPEFSYVRVSTLDEVLKATKGKIKLNIELKPTGHETDFEKNVIQIVRDNDFLEDCVLASLNYKCLQNIKAIDETLPTLYIMPVAYGNLTKLEAADHFSLESSFITESLLQELHDDGRKVFAWTVNKEENAKKMIALGVDAIITDDPIKTQQLVNQEQVTDVVQDLIEMQFPHIEPIDSEDTGIVNYDMDVNQE